MKTKSALPGLDDTALHLPALNDTVLALPGLTHADRPKERTGSKQTSAITVKIASTRAEREGAFRLVYQRYLSSGLCAESHHEMRLTPHHLLPTTTVFVALYHGEVIFTLSLVGDGERGVPMESIFPDEIQSLRDQRLRFGEISCLADRRRDMIRFLPLFIKVTSLMFQHAIQDGPYRLVIAVHPKHGRFYERFFGFRPLATSRPYHSVQNRPAAAYSLDSTWLLKERHDQYFGKLFEPEELQAQPMSDLEIATFRTVALPLGPAELLSGGYEFTQSEADTMTQSRAPGT